MKDNDKRIALIRQRDIIYSEVQPTLRECGFSVNSSDNFLNACSTTDATFQISDVLTKAINMDSGKHLALLVPGRRSDGFCSRTYGIS